MPFFSVLVIEHRTYKCRYLVEANDEEEAADKAEEGDTDKEEDIQMEEVLHRTILPGTVTERVDL